MTLPNDPIMLLSVVNMKLRDSYSSFDALCDDIDENRDDIEKTLSSVGYTYDESVNQFV